MHKSLDFENLQTLNKEKNLSHDLSYEQVIDKEKSRDFSKEKLDEFQTITERHQSELKDDEIEEENDEYLQNPSEHQIFIDQSAKIAHQQILKASERIEQNKMFRVPKIRDSVVIVPRKVIKEVEKMKDK